jgi:hypothetical protein
VEKSLIWFMHVASCCSSATRSPPSPRDPIERSRCMRTASKVPRLITVHIALWYTVHVHVCVQWYMRVIILVRCTKEGYASEVHVHILIASDQLGVLLFVGGDRFSAQRSWVQLNSDLGGSHSDRSAACSSVLCRCNAGTLAHRRYILDMECKES